MPHKSVVLVMACASFICSIGLATLTTIEQNVITGCAVFGVALVVIGRRSVLTLFGVMAITSALAFFRVAQLPVYDTPAEQWRVFTGEVVREPDLLQSKQRLVVESEDVHGRIQVTAILHPRYNVGDILEISCMLRKPEPFDGFAYDKYLERHHIASMCYYPHITQVSHRKSWSAQIFGFKRHTSLRLQKAMAGPEHTLILGSLLGINKAIPDSVAEIFRITGTSHLLVISGSHIVLMTIMCSKMLDMLTVPRRLQTLTIISVLAFYAIITGFQASAIRASLFGVTVLFAYLVGRGTGAFRVLIFAATVMLAANPLLLWHDVGFQLSFAATAGIILLNQKISEKLQWLPEFLRTLISVTIAATITTTPIIVHNFGTLAPVGLAANIVLVPMMPPIMVACIVLAIVALISLPVAQVIGIPLYYFLHLFIAIAEWFSKLPYATINL